MLIECGFCDASSVGNKTCCGFHDPVRICARFQCSTQNRRMSMHTQLSAWLTLWYIINWWSLMSILNSSLVLCTSARWSNWAHMLLRSQCTSVTWSCVAQCIASSADDVLWAESLSQQPHMQQVSPSCACIEFCTSERCTYFQATSVIRLVCRVRWSSGCWAWICNSLHQVMISDQHTHLCLHWCDARLSTVVEVGTCAALVSMHNSHKICIMKRRLIMRSKFMIDASCFLTMLSESSAPNAASVTHLCLHWCFAHLSAIL